MFRDREKALEELQRQLLEEEDEELPAEDEEDELTEEDEDDDLPQEVHSQYTENVHAYNSDTTDTDLEEYSDTVYDPPRRRTGCVLWFVLLTAAVLLILSWFLAKEGGLL